MRDLVDMRHPRLLGFCRRLDAAEVLLAHFGEAVADPVYVLLLAVQDVLEQLPGDVVAAGLTVGYGLAQQRDRLLGPRESSPPV